MTTDRVVGETVVLLGLAGAGVVDANEPDVALAVSMAILEAFGRSSDATAEDFQVFDVKDLAPLIGTLASVLGVALRELGVDPGVWLNEWRERREQDHQQRDGTA